MREGDRPTAPPTCPKCAAKFRADLEPGRRVRCSRCGTTFTVGGVEVLDALPVEAPAEGAGRVQAQPGSPRPQARPASRPEVRSRPQPSARENPSRPWLTWVLMGGGAFLAVVLVCGCPALIVARFFWPVSDEPGPYAPEPTPAAASGQPAQPVAPGQPAPPAGPGQVWDPKPPFAVDPKLLGAGPVVYLTDLQEFDVKNGPWQFGKHGSLGDPNNGVISVHGKESPHGLGMHPPNGPDFGRVRYALGGKAEVFKASVAYNDYRADLPAGPTHFSVLGDGKELWKSGAIQNRNAVEDAVVDVSGAKVLELRVQADGSNWNCHAVWLEPRLYKSKADAQAGP
jgi:predicted Zn finger-like uncharacterized protein